MSVDIYWRIAMEGEPSALRYGTATRGGLAPHMPGNIAPRPDAADSYGPVDYMREVVRSTESSGLLAGCSPRFPRPKTRGRRLPSSPRSPRPTGS